MFLFAHIFLGSIYRLIFRFRINGIENIPKDGGLILCSNHRSLHDTIVLGIVSWRRKPHFVAKQELFKYKWFNAILYSLGAIPINRENPEMKSFKRAINVLKNGETLAIFIQGGRRDTLEYADAKAGVALFAIKGQVPVVPVNITSTFRLFSKIHINIGEPLHFDEYFGKRLRQEDLAGVAQKIMDDIAILGNISISPKSD